VFGDLAAQTDELDALPVPKSGGGRRVSAQQLKLDRQSSIKIRPCGPLPRTLAKSMPSLWPFADRRRRLDGPAAAVIGPFLSRQAPPALRQSSWPPLVGETMRCLPSFSLVGQDRLPDRQLVARLHLEAP